VTFAFDAAFFFVVEAFFLGVGFFFGVFFGVDALDFLGEGFFNAERGASSLESV